LPLMNDMANEIKLLTGNSHPILARLVADRYEAFPCCSRQTFNALLRRLT
jgi:hypothetical protein